MTIYTEAKQVTADGELKTIRWKTPHNHDTKAEAIRTATKNTAPSKTQQHGKQEADINTIVDRFLKTGLLPNVPVPPTYQNFGEVFDFQSAMNTIKAATDSFMALPANIRARFDNNPAKFVGYVDHCLETGDLDPLREMGLALPRTPPDLPKEGAPPKADTPAETPKEPPSGSKT